MLDCFVIGIIILSTSFFISKDPFFISAKVYTSTCGVSFPHGINSITWEGEYIKASRSDQLFLRYLIFVTSTVFKLCPGIFYCVF